MQMYDIIMLPSFLDNQDQRDSTEKNLHNPDAMQL